MRVGSLANNKLSLADNSCSKLIDSFNQDVSRPPSSIAAHSRSPQTRYIKTRDYKGSRGVGAGAVAAANHLRLPEL